MERERSRRDEDLARESPEPVRRPAEADSVREISEEEASPRGRDPEDFDPTSRGDEKGELH
jgi:hypothetical protein